MMLMMLYKLTQQIHLFVGWPNCIFVLIQFCTFPPDLVGNNCSFFYARLRHLGKWKTKIEEQNREKIIPVGISLFWLCTR